MCEQRYCQYKQKTSLWQQCVAMSVIVRHVDEKACDMHGDNFPELPLILSAL